ncbi:MAG: hypothetical protein O2820_00110 [Planctomycetota bacterium]|nr:hypothetical protein [Planctomycetota bacterium]MDA1247598.1 hypothetical protein [Planctomycetota bacterium]
MRPTWNLTRFLAATVCAAGLAHAQSAELVPFFEEDAVQPVELSEAYEASGHVRIEALDDGQGGHTDHPPYPGDYFFGWTPYQEEAPWYWEIAEGFTHAVEAPSESLAHLSEGLFCAEHFHFETNLSRMAIGIQATPDRPALLIEWNEGFLAEGPLGDHIVTPFGATWRPSLWVFGTHRANFAYRHQQGSVSDGVSDLQFAEISQRLDIFAQLNLTGTERILFGMRPLDQETHGPASRLGREFNGYDFQGGNWIDGWNNDVQTFFFEGDFGEIFPYLDYHDNYQIDYGFTIGRQPLIAQQGLLINEDMLDAMTVTRNTLSGNGNLNLRMTGVFAWNRVSRHTQQNFLTVRDRNSKLFALLTESDFKTSTVNADVAYVQSEDDLGSMVSWGVSGIQRLHGFRNHYNTSLHFLASHPTSGRETPTTGQGELLFSRTSWTPHHGLDLIYVNAFWGIDQYASATRGPLMGGPAGGGVGILWAHTGLGQYGPPINNQTADSVGGSVGYQLQFDGTRKQVIFEVGGKASTVDPHSDTIASGMRYQQACGQHNVWILDTYVGKTESRDVATGVRVELLTKF